jgi:rod shape-determining protein MreD
MAQVTVQPLNPVVWLLTPAIACALASLLFAVPIRVLGLQPPEPVFAMAPAFAWAVIRPSVLAPIVLMALGLFLDILWGGPLGLWAVSLLVLHGAAFALRPVLTGQGFWALGAWYAVCCVLGFSTGLVFDLIASGEAASLSGLALQLGVTLALYPLAWGLIDRFEDADVRFR